MAAPVLAPVTSLCLGDPTLLYKLGHATLEAVAQSLIAAQPFVPAGITDYRFVSFNEPAWDCCPAMSVFVSNLRTNQADMARTQQGRVCCPSTYLVDVTVLILGCYTTQDPTAGIDPVLLNAEAQQLDAIGLAAWAGFLCQYRDGNIVNTGPGSGCSLMWLGPLNPVGPEGGCAGWRFTATILLEC